MSLDFQRKKQMDKIQKIRDHGFVDGEIAEILDVPLELINKPN